jgi:hypothetical protein
LEVWSAYLSSVSLFDNASREEERRPVSTIKLRMKKDAGSLKIK